MPSRILFIALWLVPLASQLNAQDSAQLIDSLCRAVVQPGQPGMAIAVKKRGKIVIEKGYGITNLDHPQPIHTETSINIGSVTKQFTAFAILRLVQQGRLSLDDRLTRFFPEFNPRIGNAITVRNLLTHSSGIADHYEYVDTAGLRHASDADVLAAIKKVDTSYFEPGEKFRYSNTGFCLLAMIIEKVSGIPYPDYMRQQIFNPLGMRQTAVWSPRMILASRATGYSYDSLQRRFAEDDANQNIFFSTEGDGGIYTSIHDYLIWCAALKTGSLLKDTLLQKAWSPQVPVDQSSGLSYGYGWFVGMAGNERKIQHTGSNGGFRAVVYWIPSSQSLIVIFANRSDLDLSQLANRIAGVCGIPHTSFE